MNPYELPRTARELAVALESMPDYVPMCFYVCACCQADYAAYERFAGVTLCYDCDYAAMESGRVVIEGRAYEYFDPDEDWEYGED